MLLVADNLHGLNPDIEEALRRLDPEPIRKLVRQCEEAGSHLIDLNPGYLSKRNQDRMAFLVETVQEATSMRLVLDSPNSGVLAKGLSVCRDKPILNALSREERKVREILPLAVEYGTDLVILLMDDQSFAPPGLDEKLALAIEMREISIEAGMAHEHLIFDPVLPNLTWDDALSRVAEDVRAVRLLASGAIFQEPVRTMAGMSNLRSGGRNRFPAKLEYTTLAMFAGAGLDFALADVLQPGLIDAYQTIERIIPLG